MTFDQWLLEKMNKAGITQSELARYSGLSQSQISRVVSGSRMPGNEFCVAIARALKIPSSEVFIRAGLMPPDPDWVPSLQEANYKFSQLSPERQELILHLLDSMIEQQNREETFSSRGKTLKEQRT